MGEGEGKVVVEDKRTSFFQAHAKGISFVGALIVFSTFVVKEGIREHLKDIADSVNSAESIFVMRNDTNDLPIYLAYMNYRIGILDNKVDADAKKEGVSNIVSMRETIDLMLANIRRTITSRENLTRAVEVLSDDSAILNNLEQVSQEVNVLRSRSDVVDKAAIAANDSQLADPGQVQHIVDKANEVIKECTELRLGKITSLQTEVIDAAEKKRARYDKLYMRSSWASYLLYAVGWGLGLAGRLFSVEGLVGGGGG